MIKMTYNEALKIQEDQLFFYCGGVSPEEEQRIRKAINDKTLPCPFDPNEFRPSWEINELVPRGTEIEFAKYGSIREHGSANEYTVHRAVIEATQRAITKAEGIK